VKKLQGLKVVCFESRLAKTLGELIALQGGSPVSAPAMREVPLENNPAVFAFAEKLFRDEVDILILLTGVGSKTLLSALETRYKREEILAAFKKTRVVPRGPKPIRVLNEWGVPSAVAVPEPNTWKEILKALDDAVRARSIAPLRGRTVAVQEYGITNPELISGLEHRGATVIRVPVYRWALPEDTRPLENAIREILNGKIQVALFTTSVQVEHLFQMAERMEAGARLIALLRDALNKMVIASVGPDCSQTLRDHGLNVNLEPESPKMGPLVQLVAEKAKEIWELKQTRK
jgi:uroporphyrinogen-III synthase